MDGIDQLLTRKRMKPGLVLTTPRSYLGDDHQVIRIGMKRLLDNLIGYVRAEKIAGIDMVHARGNGLSQNGNRLVPIPWWPPHLRTGKLHRAVAHAVYGHRGAWEHKAAAKVRLIRHSISPLVCAFLDAVVLTCNLMKKASD
jgi:hypothetical protein